MCEELLHEIPDPNVAVLKNKIQTMRSQFFRAHKLVRDSKRSGVGADKVFQPDLWFYHDISFIADGGLDLRKTFSNLANDEAEYSDGQLLIDETNSQVDSEVQLQTVEEDQVGRTDVMLTSHNVGIAPIIHDCAFISAALLARLGGLGS